MKRWLVILLILAVVSVPIVIGYNKILRVEGLQERTNVEIVAIDSLVVFKDKREMHAYLEGKYLKTYKIALGDAPKGHKHFEGDEKTPEGLYYINDRNPNSGYHKNLGISYPNAEDREFARKKAKSSGGDIKIHGLPNGQGYIGKLHLVTDWTNGCIAVTDEEVDELYEYVITGSPINIFP